MVVRVEFEPITSLSFRAPGAFGPGARGPVTRSKSLVAHITAFLGALCQFANYNNIQVTTKPLNEVKECLSQLFGNDFKIRGPFIEDEDDDLYIASRGIWNVSALLRLIKSPEQKELLEKLIRGEVVLGRKVKSIVKMGGVKGLQSSQELIGIALQRDKKSVREGYIYIQERRYLKGKYSLEVFGRELKSINGIVQLGGDSGLSKVKTKDTQVSKVLEKIPKIENSERCIVVVASPTIIDKGPLGDDAEEKVRKVFEEVGVHIEDFVNIFAPFTVEAVHLGWSMKKNTPRPWRVAIAPGSAVFAKCGKPIKEIYEEGIGEFKELGFGTVLPIPL